MGAGGKRAGGRKKNKDAARKEREAVQKEENDKALRRQRYEEGLTRKGIVLLAIALVLLGVAAFGLIRKYGG
jgi:hypothetical protein